MMTEDTENRERSPVSVNRDELPRLQTDFCALHRASLPKLLRLLFPLALPVEVAVVNEAEEQPHDGECDDLLEHDVLLAASYESMGFKSRSDRSSSFRLNTLIRVPSLSSTSWLGTRRCICLSSVTWSVQ